MLRPLLDFLTLPNVAYLVLVPELLDWEVIVKEGWRNTFVGRENLTRYHFMFWGVKNQVYLVSMTLSLLPDTDIV